MMRSGWLILGASVTTLTFAVGTVRAQPPVPGGYSRPPAFSPYLNLVRGGSPAINYYGLVRPEVQFRQALLGFSQDLAQNQQALGVLAADGTMLPLTGHPTQFMNLGGYFMNNGSLGQGMAGTNQAVQSVMRNSQMRSNQYFAPGRMGGAAGGLGTPSRR